jgi:hypothetical protein
MTRVHCGLFVLVVCWFPALSVQQTTQTSQSDDAQSLLSRQCQSAALVDGLVEWQVQISSSYISVEWGYGNVSDYNVEKFLYSANLLNTIHIQCMFAPEYVVVWLTLTYHVILWDT